jgi:hypothetical protein
VGGRGKRERAGLATGGDRRSDTDQMFLLGRKDFDCVMGVSFRNGRVWPSRRSTCRRALPSNDTRPVSALSCDRNGDIFIVAVEQQSRSAPFHRPCSTGSWPPTEIRMRRSPVGELLTVAGASTV